MTSFTYFDPSCDVFPNYDNHVSWDQHLKSIEGEIISNQMKSNPLATWTCNRWWGPTPCMQFLSVARGMDYEIILVNCSSKYI